MHIKDLTYSPRLVNKVSTSLSSLCFIKWTMNLSSTTVCSSVHSGPTLITIASCGTSAILGFKSVPLARASVRKSREHRPLWLPVVLIQRSDLVLPTMPCNVWYSYFINTTPNTSEELIVYTIFCHPTKNTYCKMCYSVSLMRLVNLQIVQFMNFIPLSCSSWTVPPQPCCLRPSPAPVPTSRPLAGPRGQSDCRPCSHKPGDLYRGPAGGLESPPSLVARSPVRSAEKFQKIRTELYIHMVCHSYNNMPIAGNQRKPIPDMVEDDIKEVTLSSSI